MSEPDIQRRFRRKRLLQMLLLPLAIAVIVVGLLPLNYRGEHYLRQMKLSFITRDIGFAIAGGAAFLYMIFTWLNWRCPSCRKLLGLRLFAQKCHACDVSFKAIEFGDSTDADDVESASRNADRTNGHDQPAVARVTHKIVRCKACPRCGSGSYRLKRPDKVMPLRRVRECRNCNQHYKGPTSKKLCLAFALIGVGLAMPLILKASEYASFSELLQGQWPLAIPAGLGVLFFLIALQKMFLQRKVKAPAREHGRKPGDIQHAYDTSGLLMGQVSPVAVAATGPMKPSRQPSRQASQHDRESAADKTRVSVPPLTGARSRAQASTEQERHVASAVVGSERPGSVAARVAAKAAAAGALAPSKPSRAESPATTSASTRALPDTPVLNTSHSADSTSRQQLRAGCVIPAHPLALNANRQLDERHTRAITRYYLDAGVGGVAIGVHTTQFGIRDQPNDMFRHVLEQTMGELFDHEMNNQKSLVKVAGICGETKQAIDEAELAAGLGYDAGLLNLAAMKSASNEQLLWHCREIAKAIPLFGFYLAPAVGGRTLDYDFWRQFAEIENVVAIKIAAFNRYDTLNVIRAVANAGRAIQPGSDNPEGIALYTGNDDNIVGDLLGEWTFDVAGQPVTQRIVGGLLGHWAVWTKAAVDTFDSIRAVNAQDELPKLSTALNRQVTDMNAAVFDAAHGFKGCVPGIHEVLRRQGLLEGIWCLDENETLSPGQADEITRVIQAYPHLTDDEFVAENRDHWLR